MHEALPTKSMMPARVGDSIEAILTPALIVDLNALEANIALMAREAGRMGIGLWPHAKAHKSPDIALLQVAAGAAGICCQKVSEAEVFVEAGIRAVLLSNQVVQREKVQRLASLATRASITVCVDDLQQVRLLGEAAAAAGARLGVLIEIDVGHGRCGVAGSPEACRLAEAIAGTPSLKLRGLQAYHGAAQHFRLSGQRAQAIAEAACKAAAVRDALRSAGFPAGTIAGGGTGTWQLEAASNVYSEIQPGSYVFMDAAYAGIEAPPAFAQALVIRTTVISVASGSRFVVDGGYKAMAVDSGPPRPVRADVQLLGMSDEHTVLSQSGHAPLRIGDTVDFIPGHIDPSVNLHEWYVGARNGRVEVMWPVAARGPGL